MAPEAWVSDSSPLILLGKIGRLDLMIGSSERLLIPQAVADEVAAKSDGIRLIAELSTEARITFIPSVIVPSELLAWGLGAKRNSSPAPVSMLPTAPSWMIWKPAAAQRQWASKPSEPWDL